LSADQSYSILIQRDDPGSIQHQTLKEKPVSLSKAVQWFKTMTTNAYVYGMKQHSWTPFPGKLWQRNFFERIIRTDDELNRIRAYIVSNPAEWDRERANPDQRIK